jgi:hypothetical protein
MTSSARASNVGGIVKPNILAVFKLITSSYLVGACTGRSAGFLLQSCVQGKGSDPRHSQDPSMSERTPVQSGPQSTKILGRQQRPSPRVRP